MEITDLPINEAELTTIRLSVEDSPELFGDGSDEEVAMARVETLQLHAIRLLEVVDAFMVREGGSLANDLRQVVRARVLQEKGGRQLMRGNVTLASLSASQSVEPISGEALAIVDIRLKVSAT